jgi:hypothetical protein
MPKHPLSPDAKKPPAKKYYSKFNNAWIPEFKCVQASSKGPDFALCLSCKLDFKIAYGGRNDITRHIQTPSHWSNDSSVTNTPTLKALFETGSKVDKVTLAQTLFANFVAEHNLPFLIADHFTKLVKVMFPD